MNNTYQYVALIGIDGMGNFNRKTETPCMDAIFADGAVTYDALSMDPTISAQNWGAMLLGANPAVHGLTNSIVSTHPYTNEKLPSVFAMLRRQFPDAYLAACNNWNPINIGIIEDGIGADKHTAENDASLTPIILDCVAKKPKYLFVQFDDTDGAGHRHGYGSEGHLAKITETDALVGQIYEAYRKAGILDETLFMVTADHGGNLRSHGGYTDGEKYIYFAATGKGIEKSRVGHMTTKDMAAVVLYALGLGVPAYDADGFSAQIPEGLFPEYTKPYFRPEARSVEYTPSPTPAADAKDGLFSFTDRNRVLLALFLDNDLKDAAGRHTATEQGLCKYYSGGVYGARGEFGATGCAVYEDLKIGDNDFTVAAWLRIDRSLHGEADICATKGGYGPNRKDKGFILVMRNNDTFINIGIGDDDDDFITAFPENVKDGWLHTAVSVDRQKGEIRCYYNFRLAHTGRFDKKLLTEIDCLPFTVGDDASRTFNAERNIIFNMDDFLVLNGTFSDEDAKKLAAYYKFEI